MRDEQRVCQAVCRCLALGLRSSRGLPIGLAAALRAIAPVVSLVPSGPELVRAAAFLGDPLLRAAWSIVEAAEQRLFIREAVS